MSGFKCIFVEKKDGFNVEAKSLMEDFKSNLRINNLQNVRVVNKYILGEIKEDLTDKKDILWSWIRRLKTVKPSTLSPNCFID